MAREFHVEKKIDAILEPSFVTFYISTPPIRKSLQSPLNHATMLTVSLSSKTVAAALSESRSGSRSSSSSGGSALAAAAMIAGRQRRRATLQPSLVRGVPILASRPAAAVVSASAASAATSASAPTIQTKLGPLTVRPLAEADVTAAAVVLTRAFTANGSSPPLADVEEWLSAALNTSSETAVLVGELVPEDKELLAPGKRYRVAGVAAVALSAAAAAAAVGSGGGSDGSSAGAPLSVPLLCNVAVDPRLRRLGIGRALVSAAEEVAKQQGGGGSGGSLFVVARGSEDTAAEKLYSSLGFAEAENQSENKGGNFFSSLFGSKASAEKLMKKEL